MRPAMTMAPPLVVIGAGGHARVAADLATRAHHFVIAAFLDDVHPERMGSSFCGSTIVGDCRELERLWQAGVRHAFVAVGQNEARLRLALRARAAGFTLAVLRHPSAVCAADAAVGAGTMLAAGSIVAPAAVLGDQVIVNTAASVDHECTIGDGVHLGPGVRLGGAVTVGRAAWIGIGAVVRDRATIGAGAIVGAGAVVVDDVPEAMVAYGNPARVVRPVSHAEAALY